MKEYDGSVQLEIVAIKYAFPEGQEPYRPMFAFKPRIALGPAMFQQQLIVIHNATLSSTDQTVALGETLTTLIHPDHLNVPVKIKANKVP